MTTRESKLALVTGGTGGIGTAICKKLLDSGYAVATNYRNEEKAREWQTKLEDEGYLVEIFPGDVAEFESCKHMIAEIETRLASIDILVNNAGITRDTTLKKMTPEQWHAVLNTNLNSVFNLTRPVINGMQERGFGRVINIASINGQKGQMGQTNYSAAKAGMHGFTKALAQEVASKGVTVNTISPGYIATEMVMAVPEKIREKIIAQIPVGRLGKPEEIAAAVAYLASDAAAFITGSELSINGGQHMY
ncbi:MAG: acetoacetyl-CoA reductase [Candidatus Sedimenticola sp. 20ELBAFRAG]